MVTKFDVGDEAFLKVKIRDIHSYEKDKVKYSISTGGGAEIAGVVEEQLVGFENLPNETRFIPIVYKDPTRNSLICEKCEGEVVGAVVSRYKFCPFCGRKVKNDRN